MNKTLKALTILGSPHDAKSNTRAIARERNRKKARQAARLVLEGCLPRTSSIQRKMFKVMQQKIAAFHAVRCLHREKPVDEPRPSGFFTKLISRVVEKTGITDEELKTWAGLMSFEFGWWKERGWLDVKSFSDLAARPVPADFNVRNRLLHSGEAS